MLTFTIIIVVILFIAFLIWGHSQNEKDKEAYNNKLLEIQKNGFVVSDSIKLLGLALAWDTQNRKVALISMAPQGLSASFFDFEAIRDTEILRDNEVVTKKSTGRTVGGAIVGGVLLGGVGAVVGGLSGGSKSIEKLKSLALKIHFNSIERPSITLPFINSLTLDTEKPKLIAEAEKWNDRFSAIIDEVNKKHITAYQSNVLPSTGQSVADEIMKLKGLLDSNIISQEEFDAQKKRLLNA